MKSWWSRLTRRSEPPEEWRDTIDAWRATRLSSSAPWRSQRLVCVDVETTGLDPHADTLIAIGAVAIDDGKIALGDSFEVVIQQALPSSEANILIHRLGSDVQRGGVPLADALLAFAQYVKGAPMIGYHATFDEVMIARAWKKSGKPELPMTWLDLAEIAPAIATSAFISSNSGLSRAGSLDAWLQALGIPVFQRHQATADAFATAQLFVWCLPTMDSQGVATVAEARALARAWRWSQQK